MVEVIITAESIDVENIRRLLPHHPCCGAEVCFLGRVRNVNDGQAVVGIEYECYEAMAKLELEKLGQEACTRFSIHQIAVAHRVGRLAVGDVSLAMVIRAPHRAAAFEASSWFIDELKKRVPIWKQEGYTDGQTKWIEL